MTLLAEANGAQVWHRDWRGLLDVVPACDALIVDAPYSERTHKGHDGGTAAANRFRTPWTRTWTADDKRGRAGRTGVDNPLQRRSINYGAWSPEDVAEFAECWAPKVRG
jgi:hypothetical protein